VPKGFDKATSTLKKLRLLMRIGGLEKQGKTHFALTAPGAVGVLDNDRGIEGVVEKFADEKDIYVKSFREMPMKTPEDYTARWNAFDDYYHRLLSDVAVRSIVWDTDTETWEMARLAYFGRPSNIPLKYPPLNALYRKLIDEAYDADKNLILISRYKKQYVRKSPTSDDSAWNGKYEAAGFGELKDIVQVNLRARLVEDEETGKLVPSVEVINCRQNMSENGEIYYGDEACFSWIAAMIIEGTTPEDWE